MKVDVKLHGTLRRYRPNDASGAPHHPFTVSLPEGTTVAELVSQLSIRDGFLNAASVNGEAVTNDTALHDGDSVQLFPPSAGG